MSRFALALTGALLAIPLAAAMTGDGKTGQMAPEIAVDKWFNHVGRELSLKNLRGQAVLIEFWATW